MEHCRLVKMGLTAEVKGCVFSERHPVFRRNVENRTSLPMCHCLHVKDGLPQLGDKKTHQWRAKTAPRPSKRTATGPQTFPPHLRLSDAFMCECEHAPHNGRFYVHATLAHPPNVRRVRRVNDFKGFCLAEVQVFQEAPLVTQLFPSWLLFCFAN